MFLIFVIQKGGRGNGPSPHRPTPHLLGSEESVPNESPSFRRNETEERLAASDLRRFSIMSLIVRAEYVLKNPSLIARLVCQTSVPVVIVCTE